MDRFDSPARLMLVSDLDLTMVHHQCDEDNISQLRFNALWESNYRHDSLLVFSTGRTPEYHYNVSRNYGESMIPYSGWEQFLNQKWDKSIVKEETDKFPELTYQARFVTLFIILLKLDQHIKIVFSGGEALDVLPKCGGKGEALAYLLKKVGHGKQPCNTLVCGDSGNEDLHRRHAFERGFTGIMCRTETANSLVFCSHHWVAMLIPAIICNVTLAHVFLVLLTAYGSAASGQLFFFHVVLIRKGMRTYDYILELKEANESIDPFSDSGFSSDDRSYFYSPEKPTFIFRFVCDGHKAPARLSIRIDGEPNPSALNKKPGFRANIDPWKLIKMSSEKALLVAEKTRERIMKQTSMKELESLKPLPLEMKSGPLMMNPEKKNMDSTDSGITPLVTKGWFPGSRVVF
ncbi:hypothetical protein MKX03_009488 [Papaver bracteatum]|nr:hypothetical protein MKX03_009488 [Papaver bracteatum]